MSLRGGARWWYGVEGQWVTFTSLTITLARVYGAMDAYGDGPRQAIPTGPIVMPNWPRDDCTTAIAFGAAPEQLLEAERLNRAFGLAFLDRLISRAKPGQGLDDSIEEALARVSPPVRIESFNWFISITVECEVPETPPTVHDGKHIIIARC
jgi:hypothetical protein